MTVDVAELLPHAFDMVLLDKVTSHDETSLIAETIIKESSMFYRPAEDSLTDGEAGVPSWIGIEYMAQAVAAWSGIRERSEGNEPKVGFLVNVKEYSASHHVFPLGSRLSISVTARDKHGPLSVFEGEIEADGITAYAVIGVFEGEPPKRGSSEEESGQ